MLPNVIKCNHFDISVRDNEIDLQSLIPSSILPSGDELAEMQEYEEEMQDGSGADAIP